jgi:hypothetical protein
MIANELEYSLHASEALGFWRGASIAGLVCLPSMKYGRE